MVLQSVFNVKWAWVTLSLTQGWPKVVPLQNKEEETPLGGPVDFAFTQNLEENSLYSFARLQDRNKALEGQLPPLRETWYGRYSEGKCKTQQEICGCGQKGELLID